jgi:uncharacterized protein
MVPPPGLHQPHLSAVVSGNRVQKPRPHYLLRTMTTPVSPPVLEPPRPYRPAWWLPGAHVQTVVGKFLRPRPVLPLAQERWETPDGDLLELVIGPDPGRDRPVVLVLHGLEGNVDRGYVQLTLQALLGRGALALALNFRGCGSGPNRRPRFYHSGDTTDVSFVVEEMGRRFPGRPVGVVAYSLGGNMLLRYMGERGEGVAPHLGAAAAVSVPFDLAGGTGVLERGIMGRVYSHYFLRSLRQKVSAKRALLESTIDVERALAARTLRIFDDHATAPLHGFRDSAHYYDEARVEPVLEAIRVPTLLLASRDDPFLPPDSIPEETVARNPWLVPAFTPSGGHVGFVSGAHPFRPRFWAEEESARWVLAHLERGRPAP